MNGFGSDERLRAPVMGVNDIHVLPELLDRGEGCTVHELFLQDRKPILDLVEPGTRVGGEGEPNVGVALEPAVILGLWVLSIEDNMDGVVADH